MTRPRVLLAAVGVVILLATRAHAFDPEVTFAAGSVVLAVEAGKGAQMNLRDHGTQTGLDVAYAGMRLGFLPAGPFGPPAFRGALELGFEAQYQTYTGPVDAYWAGLGVVARYHLLSLGRLVPYLEGGASAGATDLDVKEIRSDFAFHLFVGLGVAMFLTDRLAIYGGYRLVHVSNGHLDSPNGGVEAHTGLVGLAYFFGK